MASKILHHRAYDPQQEEYVYWTSPEFDGTGYYYFDSEPPYQLESIVVFRVVQKGGGEVDWATESMQVLTA